MPRLFDHDLDAQIEYARKPEFKPQLKRILEINRRYDELAEIHIGEGNLDQGVSCYIKSFESHRSLKSIQVATDIAVAHAEPAALIEGRYRKNAHEQARRLAEAVQPYASELSVETGLYVSTIQWLSIPKFHLTLRKVELLYSILSLRHVSLDLVGAWDRSRSLQRRRSILARHFALDNLEWIESGFLEDVLGYLNIWKEYSSDILGLANLHHPSNSTDAQALLGFAPNNSNPTGVTFQVLQDSFLFTNNPSTDNKEQPGPAIDKLVSSRLLQGLMDRLYKLHVAIISSSRSLFTLHSSIALLPAAGSNNRLNDTMQAISRLLPVLDVIVGKERVVVIKAWLRRLFDIARPLSGAIKDLSELQTCFIRDASTPTLVKWLEYDSSTSISSWPDAFVALTLSSAWGRAILDGVIGDMRQSNGRLNRFNHQAHMGYLISLFEGAGSDRLVNGICALE